MEISRTIFFQSSEINLDNIHHQQRSKVLHYAYFFNLIVEIVSHDADINAGGTIVYKLTLLQVYADTGIMRRAAPDIQQSK